MRALTLLCTCSSVSVRRPHRRCLNSSVTSRVWNGFFFVVAEFCFHECHRVESGLCMPFQNVHAFCSARVEYFAAYHMHVYSTYQYLVAWETKRGNRVAYRGWRGLPGCQHQQRCHQLCPLKYRHNAGHDGNELVKWITCISTSKIHMRCCCATCSTLAAENRIKWWMYCEIRAGVPSLDQPLDVPYRLSWTIADSRKSPYLKRNACAWKIMNVLLSKWIRPFAIPSFISSMVEKW